jgi:predicted nucleotidyltransferase
MAATERSFRPQEILETLAEFGVDFVVVGGVAVQAHGYLRGTGDLDVVPRPTSLNLSRLAEALADLESEVWRADRPVNVTDPNLLRRAPLVPLVTRFGRLDLLNIEQTAGAPASYDDLVARALIVELGGHEVAIAGIDDLIRMKRAAGREQDLADIAALARADDELERDVAEKG